MLQFKSNLCVYRYVKFANILLDTLAFGKHVEDVSQNNIPG